MARSVSVSANCGCQGVAHGRKVKIKWSRCSGGGHGGMCVCVDAAVYPLGQDLPQISFVALGDIDGEMKSK